jgi:hypothetical protein
MRITSAMRKKAGAGFVRGGTPAPDFRGSSDSLVDKLHTPENIRSADCPVPPPRATRPGVVQRNYARSLAGAASPVPPTWIDRRCHSQATIQSFKPILSAVRYFADCRRPMALLELAHPTQCGRSPFHCLGRNRKIFHSPRQHSLSPTRPTRGYTKLNTGRRSNKVIEPPTYSHYCSTTPRCAEYRWDTAKCSDCEHRCGEECQDLLKFDAIPGAYASLAKPALCLCPLGN